MIVDLNQPYYPYDKFISDAKSLAEQYNTILQYVTIGTSHDNRDIVLLKLGIGKQYMVCCSGVHARETVNPMVLLAIIEYYADLYANYKQQKIDLKSKLYDDKQYYMEEYGQMLYGACINELLQTFTILFVPMLNPDGYMIALDGFEAIRDLKLREQCRTMGIDAKVWKYNARGVDINRNFPCRLWKPKNDKDYAASEQETQALVYLFHEYRTRGFLDFHSRGRQIYYYRSMLTDSYNNRQLAIAKRLKKVTGYILMPPEEEIEAGDTGGNTVHYYSERFHKPALTIETVDEAAAFPLDISHRISTFKELKLVIFIFGSMIMGI